MQGAFQTLVPALRLDLTASVDFGRVAGGGDSGINGRFALLGDFGLLTKEATEKVVRRMAACF